MTAVLATIPLVDAVRARDRDALASFYDERAGRVREYCALVCPAELVDEATLVAFVDFLGRLDRAPASLDLDELLCTSTRGAAAGRAEVGEAPASSRSARRRSPRAEPGPTCLAMPELLAAYASGELASNGQLDQHLVECAVCRTTATRFRQAEGAFTREPREQPPDEVRRVWLEIALSGRVGVVGSSAASPSAVPDAASAVPDATSPVPDAPSAAPDAPNPVPDAPNPVPEVASSVPEAASPVLDASRAVPEAPSQVPDTPSPVPDTTSTVPEAPGLIPDPPRRRPRTYRRRF